MDKLKQIYVGPYAAQQATAARRTTTATVVAGGFTIIEVIIVLAIAALILLVVFMAVPALQRGQRNNARKNDASRIAAQLISFTANSASASLPSTSSTADCTSVYSSSANLSQLTNLTCTVTALGTGTAPAANTFYVQTTAYAAPASPSGANPNAVILVEGNICSGSSATTATGATTRSMALMYTLESGSTYSFGCVNAQ